MSDLRSSSMGSALNPNAAVFVPSSLQFASGSRDDSGLAPGTSRHVIPQLPLLDAPEDEAHRYWLQQLPDDIIPDFGSEDGLKTPGDISLSGLSIRGDGCPSRYAVTRDYQLPDEMRAVSAQGNGVGRYDGFPGFDYSGENPSLDYSSSDSNFDLADVNLVLENTSVDPIDFLSSNFPGFASECLADVYYANGSDLSSTIEILTQLEVQLGGGYMQSQISESPPSSPSFSSLDFPSLPMSDEKINLTDSHRDTSPQPSGRNRSIDKENISFLGYCSSHLKGDQDFASAVRKCVPPDNSLWRRPGRGGSTERVIGPTRDSVHQSDSYRLQGKSIFGDKTQSNGSQAPVWLETGHSVGSLYSESREDARDFARIRNACFEQARQAYLIGNKALAKELSLKGKVYGMQMAAAHEKARELIYKQRNPVTAETQSLYRGKELMIDLHGLHVSEALYTLKHELGVLRKTARATGRKLQVLICVGTGHHTKGSRTPARLPVAVQKYLLEEGLLFSEQQPGLFCIVIH